MSNSTSLEMCNQNYNSKEYNAKETHDEELEGSINQDENDTVNSKDSSTSTTSDKKRASQENLKGHDKVTSSSCNRLITSVRSFCGTIVNSFVFQITIIILILINAIVAGIGTYDFVTENPVTDAAFVYGDGLFLIIFTIELTLEFIYNGSKFFRDGWLVFDLITVVASWSFAHFQVIRSFRIFRAIKLIKRIKSVRELVNAIVHLIPKVSAITFLMLLIFYIFAVLFTSMFKDIPLDDHYFKRLDWTFLTLFEISTLSWVHITQQLQPHSPAAFFLILAFIIITSFIALNLIVAVLCDAIFELHQSRDDEEDDNDDGRDETIVQKRLNDLTCQMKMMQEWQNVTESDLLDLITALHEKGVVEATPEMLSQ